MRRFIWIFLFLSIRGGGEILTEGHFEIQFSSPLSYYEQQKTVEILNESELFLVSILGEKPSDVLSITLFSSVQEMKETLKIPYYIGGWYYQGKIWLQPVSILIKKNVLEKTVFIEYAHFYFDFYTRNNCPDWLNEILSLYYYRLKIGKQIQKPDLLLKTYQEFSSLSKNLFNSKKIKVFFETGVAFLYYLNQEFPEWNRLMLTKLKTDLSFEKAFQEICGKSVEEVYEKDFMSGKKIKKEL